MAGILCAKASCRGKGVQGVNTLKIAVIAGCLFLNLVPAWAAKVNGVISSQGDTVHLELSGQQNWNYDVKRLDPSSGKTGPVVEMTVDGLDEASVHSLAAFKSDLVKSVSVNAQGPDGKSVVSFTLSGEDVETFDYLTDQPSRLIVDFYLTPEAKKKSAEAKKVTKPVAKITKTAKTDGKEKTDKNRKPASSDALTVAPQGLQTAQLDEDQGVRHGIFDGGDPQFERFTIKDYEIKGDAEARAGENYYMPFPQLETPVEAWEKIKVTPTVYEIKPKDTEENKQARLLLTLFEKQRYGVYLKTQEWFKEKYPKSEYSEIIDFMTADVYFALWQDKNRPADYDQAMERYSQAVEKYPLSPLAERTSLKLAFYALEKGDNLTALRLFKKHIDNKNFNNKESLSKDLAKIGSGLAYMKTGQWEDAIAQYEDVEKNSPSHDLRVEASYRRGDVWAKARNYVRAVEEYEKSLKKYPEGRNFYPNAYYNQAESLFDLKKFPQSLDVYRDFVKKFPSSNHAPFAMTRMGELLEILGADKSRVIGAYLETYFRYGENPSAIIARLRLLSARMKGMKPKELSNAVSEIMSLAKKIDLPNIEQFATVMVADGYTQRGDYQKSIDLLSKYYKEHPTTVDVPLINNRIVANINDKIQGEVDGGDFIKALKTHNQYLDNWLKSSKRMDTKYNIGRAFEMAGVPEEAEKYYKEVLNNSYAAHAPGSRTPASVSQNLPPEDELNLRLASIASQEQKNNQAYEFLKNIKAPEKMSDQSQIERVDLAVRLLEKRGDTDSAIRYLGELLRTWKGQPQLVAEPYMKLSELLLKQNKTGEAIEALSKIDKLMQDSGAVAPPLHEKALEMLGDIYLDQKKNDKAIAAYSQMLEKYEETRPLASIRYKLGQIYFKQGDIKKAAEIWGSLNDKSGFWKNLAQEQLKNAEWRDGYKKYIKRIPAMSESESGK